MKKKNETKNLNLKNNLGLRRIQIYHIGYFRLFFCAFTQKISQLEERSQLVVCGKG